MKEKNELSVQIYSDLHIEHWNKLPHIIPKSKYLFLAGDICCLQHPLFFSFFDYCSANWEKTYYVPGNHEFYSNRKNYQELDFDYKYKISNRYSNVYYLNNEHAALNEDINVYGSTFWTEPPYATTYESKIYINDYNNIKYFNKQLGRVKELDVLFMKELSTKACEQLNMYLNTNISKKTIIMSHFPPYTNGTNNPKYANNNTEQKYFSWNDDILENIVDYYIPCWISGHTHWSYDFVINNTRLISNQLGYQNELGKTNINENGIYNIII